MGELRDHNYTRAKPSLRLELLSSHDDRLDSLRDLLLLVAPYRQVLGLFILKMAYERQHRYSMIT